MGISRVPSYRDSLDLGASPTTGRKGEEGRGQAQDPRKDGDDARDDEPPEPEVFEAEVEVLNLLDEVTDEGGVATSVSHDPKSTSANKENLW